MIRAKIIGAGGYGGVGLTEILLRHPEVEIAALVDQQDVGSPFSTLYPHLDGICDLSIVAPDDPAASRPVNVTFFSTPDRVGMALARRELDAGAKVIDYSGDFRFNSTATYAEYARRLGIETEHEAPDLLPEAIYGLPELRRNELSSETRIVGNAGCFAVSCILGLAPAAKYKLIDLKSVICDCKTGVSGAGKKPGPLFHYPARYDHMNAYRLAGHQHVCEIEHELGKLAGTELRVTFTPQVVPACRGILSCLYATLADGVTPAKVMDAYQVFHKDNRFVRLYDRNDSIGTMHVRGGNFCRLIVDVDEVTRRLRVVSHIDNLVKGQSGNAVQNMNLLFGFPESVGLDIPSRYP
jgi:N-acetyl-gamma-glutamyl-phosphate reductase